MKRNAKLIREEINIWDNKDHNIYALCKYYDDGTLSSEDISSTEYYNLYAQFGERTYYDY